jgi:hypothetical protein
MRCENGIHDESGQACFETTVTPKNDRASARGILSGIFKNLANVFIHTYNATSDIAEQVDGIPNGEYTHHKLTPFEYRSTAEDRGAVIATGVSLLGSAFERIGLKASEIGFSTRRVATAAKSLQSGASTIRVATKSEAEELFLRLYQGAGYRNSTGMGGAEARRYFGSKAGTYHWDTAAGHGPTNPHGSGPHLQIHTKEGPVVRIFYGPER